MPREYRVLSRAHHILYHFIPSVWMSIRPEQGWTPQNHMNHFLNYMGGGQCIFQDGIECQAQF